jgi:mRNA interferase RelE/StbE
MKKTSKLIFNKKALKQLNQLDAPVRHRIIQELQFLSISPLSGKFLIERLSGLYSLRVGKYRVVYQISETKVIIQTVKLRKNVYDL